MFSNVLKKIIIFLSAAGLFLLAGCSSLPDLSNLELPPLPTVTPSPEPTPVPTYVPKITPTPSAPVSPPTSVPLSPSPTASSTAEPVASASPVPSPTSSDSAEDTVVASPTPDIFLSQQHDDLPPVGLSITDYTVPEDMVECNVATLYGIISAENGLITMVRGSIVDASGKKVQDATHYPGGETFSLAGTLNAELRFAGLAPGTYRYVVTAAASNDVDTVEETLIDHSFTVYPAGGTSQLTKYADTSQYAPQRTEDTSSEGQIWNYFVGQFNNPVGAAAVLANINAESSCFPQRVEGDLSSKGTVSSNYTQSVDDGSISLASFISDTPGKGYGNGYGLCQWTRERKAGLYYLAQERGTSVGDLMTQCEYIMMELTNDYPTLLEYLWTVTDPRAAAREFCYVFEQAASAGDRADIAESYLEKYALVE